MRISDESLRGRTVIGADGRAIGEITGLTVDSDGWCLSSIQVKLRKEAEDQLGVHHRMFRSVSLDVPIRAVQSVGDAVVLSVTIDSLRELTTPGEQPAVQ